MFRFHFKHQQNPKSNSKRLIHTCVLSLGLLAANTMAFAFSNTPNMITPSAEQGSASATSVPVAPRPASPSISAETPRTPAAVTNSKSQSVGLGAHWHGNRFGHH